MQLSKELGITQKSAWFLLHRLREACFEKNIKQLLGMVEMDETYIGGKEQNKHQHKKTKGTQGRRVQRPKPLWLSCILATVKPLQSKWIALIVTIFKL